MANFQYIPYTLVAVGLINAVYRQGDSAAMKSTILMIAAGILLFIASRVQSLNTALAKPSARIATLVISSLLILSTLIF